MKWWYRREGESEDRTEAIIDASKLRRPRDEDDYKLDPTHSLEQRINPHGPVSVQRRRLICLNGVSLKRHEAC